MNSAKYLLIVATEAALDICNHLVSRRGQRSPADYADCIGIPRPLREAEVPKDGGNHRLTRGGLPIDPGLCVASVAEASALRVVRAREPGPA